MKPFTLIHTADLHLDLPVSGWKGSEEQLMVRRDEYRRTFSRILELAKRREAAFLLIAGDFLEHDTVSRPTVEWVIEEFRRIPDTRVLIAPGNHDPYRSDSFYQSVPWPEHVHIFSGRWEDHYFPDYNLRVYGKGFADFEERESRLPGVDPADERRVMVAHATYGPRTEKSSYFPLSREEIHPLEMDYVALGHIHQPSTDRLDNQRRTLVRYPGSPEALRWKETGERTVSLVTFDEKGVHLETEAVQTRRYEVDFVDMTGCRTPEEAVRRILNRFPEPSARSVYRRLHLKGRCPRDLSLNGEWISLQLVKEGFLYVECLDETVPDFDLDRLRAEDGLVGTFIRRMDERAAKADGEEKKLLERALYKGLDALLLREVKGR
ncbi:metallophosphoesterase family protein [Paludifilum halophilum]|uniref:Calcineurin-like phosphoesterase domain-containing protein n=1 Tax=Paludifilum halophilum TaxID=1642702 RepID=A0A235BA66_9BACL|nr:DNA repair exonuclease [Paludifilum halophilum]OYD08879.1 hypothetical protein CHM34_03600 [Paludifilum halophilum]